MKKSITLILALVMLLALVACAPSEDAPEIAPGEKLAEGTTIVMTVPSSPSWPVDEDWPVWRYMEEGTGAELDLRIIPDSDLETKYSIMLTSPETVPDVAAFASAVGHRAYMTQGALLALEDLEEYMPAYNAWVDSLTEDQYQHCIVTRKAADGKVYYTPGSGREGVVGQRAWLYRKDIFEKHNLKTPTTFDELYEVCKTLKGLYPDSYPYCIRGGFDCIDASGSSFKKWWRRDVYYDFENEVWEYGAREETAREIVTFYKKMVDEKLMPADFVTLPATTWEELIMTDRGFILPHFQSRIDFFIPYVKDNNPDFELQAFVPPVANQELGYPAVYRRDFEAIGVSIPNSGDEERIANAARFVDWYYTDEGKELLSWGKEGETYEVVDGKKQFIGDGKGTGINTLYGFQLYGSFTILDREAVLASQSERIAETRDLVAEHTLPYINPADYLAFTDEESKVISDIGTACRTYIDSMLVKFILGQEPISNFDAYVEELNSLGVDELLPYYETAYNRIK